MVAGNRFREETESETLPDFILIKHQTMADEGYSAALRETLIFFFFFKWDWLYE